MATRHASAVKAHRQTITRTQRNRELRSELRTALRTIRGAIDAGRADDARAILSDTFSLIDKTAAKGIIHDNAAGRYKSRLVTSLAKPRLGATPGPATKATKPGAGAKRGLGSKSGA